MASITDNIKKIEAGMKNPTKKARLGVVLKNTAIDAISNGIGSVPWKEYMSMFADNQAQLDRLTVAKPTDETWLKEARAYALVNSICAPNTNTKTGNGIFDNPLIAEQIDKSLGTDVEDGIKNLRPEDFRNVFP